MLEYPKYYLTNDREVMERKNELEKLIYVMLRLKTVCELYDSTIDHCFDEYFRILKHAKLYDAEIVRDKTKQNLTAIRDAVRKIQDNTSFVRSFLCEMQHDMSIELVK